MTTLERDPKKRALGRKQIPKQPNVVNLADRRMKMMTAEKMSIIEGGKDQPPKKNGEKWFYVITTAVSIASALLVSVFTTGLMIGKYEEKFAQINVDRAALSSQVTALTSELKSLNDTVVSLTVGMNALRVANDDLKTALTNERQDRLNWEHEQLLRPR